MEVCSSLGVLWRFVRVFEKIFFFFVLESCVFSDVFCGEFIFLWQFMAVCGSLWQFVTVCGSLWQFVVVCGSL